MKKICVLGLGYIGLPTASIFANNGFEVIGVDIDQSVVNTINQGNIHIKEPGLNTIVRAAVNSGNLIASTTPKEADVFIIAVPTPITDQKKADLSFIKSAVNSIIPHLRNGNLVILESTIPPRTTVDIVVPLLEKSGLEVGTEIYVAHCPERVLPGNILHELIYNNRIIGGINEQSSQKAKELYERIVQGDIVITDATSAEMAKLMENTFRDVNIALANELCKIAYDIKLDALEVIKLANMHPRVNIHSPGPGVGGHCLAVDPWFIVEKSKFAELIKLGRNINDNMPKFVATRALQLLKDIEDPVVTILGVAYKGNVDDTRESPATSVIKELIDNGVSVRVYDPHVKNYEYELFSLEEAFRRSNLVLVLADHSEFKYLSASELGKLMRRKAVFDTKNCLNHLKWEKAGFLVEVLGKYSSRWNELASS
ncbi:nucleotide sugar dehydrogenase [Peptococcaceae bacterium]|nr:nucleotide sugar dehydrogenase [Peptococcaceae bacterium]